MAEQTVPYFIFPHSFANVDLLLMLSLPLPQSTCIYCSSFSSSMLYARFYFCNPIMYKYMYIIELCANFIDRISPYKCKHMYIKLTVLLGTCYTQRIVKPIFERFVWMWKRGNSIDSDSNISNSNINGDGHACHHFFSLHTTTLPPGCYFYDARRLKNHLPIYENGKAIKRLCGGCAAQR